MDESGTSNARARAHEKATTLVANLEARLRAQRAADVVTADEVEALIAELRADEAYWSTLEPRFNDAWTRMELRLRQEERPLRDLLTEHMIDRAVEAAGNLEPDTDAVGAFLRSPAVEAMLGDLLYTGITEFLRRADLIGAIIDKLPVIGSIRKKVMATFADEVERRLEGQIKGFLGGFSGMAVERMIQFIFREENRPGFRSAQRKLMEHLLSRPLNTLVPNDEQMRWLRESVWSSLREVTLEDEREIIDLVFELAGDAPLGDWMWPLSTTARGVGARALAEFWDSEEGRAFEP